MSSSVSALWAETSRAWTSGRWSAELRGDEIADLAVDGAVVLRSVRAVVRDRDWDTAALTVDEVIEREGGLTIRVHTRELGATCPRSASARSANGRAPARCGWMPPATR